uniref:Uncharacterized protein n=1 Tax=Arundo donax TaxID=35708 RepID=A0A0A8YQJ3_ARUDO
MANLTPRPRRNCMKNMSEGLYHCKGTTSITMYQHHLQSLV